MLISARNGATQLCMFEQRVAPGIGAPTHSHPVEEVLTVREGEAEMWMDDERVTVSAGQSLIVPAGRKHGFRNSGEVTLHIHAVLASPIFEATRRAQRSRCGGGRRSSSIPPPNVFDPPAKTASRQAKRKSTWSWPTMSLTLHYHPLSSYCRKALIALERTIRRLRPIWSICPTPGSAPRC